MTKEHNEETSSVITETTDDPITYPVFLTTKEILFIDDNLRMMVHTSESQHGSTVTTIRPLARQHGIPVATEFIKKIGNAVLSATDTDNRGRDTCVNFEEIELWIMRELSLSEAIVENDTVGLDLKKKIYTALWGEAYHNDKVARGLLARAKLLTG